MGIKRASKLGQRLGALASLILPVTVSAAVAQTPPDDVRLDLVQMTIALRVNATSEEVDHARAEALQVMSRVHQCQDLYFEAEKLKGSVATHLPLVRVGDLRANSGMYQKIPKLSAGETAGPYRVAEGFMVVAMCGRSRGKSN